MGLFLDPRLKRVAHERKNEDDNLLEFSVGDSFLGFYNVGVRTKNSVHVLANSRDSVRRRVLVN